VSHFDSEDSIAAPLAGQILRNVNFRRHRRRDATNSTEACAEEGWTLVFDQPSCTDFIDSAKMTKIIDLE